MRSQRIQSQNGAILITILLVMVFLTAIIFGSLTLAGSSLYRAKSRIMLLQAQYAAESGVDIAIAKFNSGDEAYAGANSEVTVLNSTNYKATFTSSIAAGGNDSEKLITAVGKVYRPAAATTPSYTRKIRVVVQRSTTDMATSLMARNIIYIASGVKTITAQDVYANGFIHMSKNTTDLIAENITVADRDTGATNCSIGGSGNLVKPSSFTDPTQTKTNIVAAYNNCISPPGNISSSDFNVSANQNNIYKIASTYIPWSQYMNSTYQNAPGGCNDWLAASPVTIPSTGNTKKTHYPNSDSGVLNSCGTSGSLALGSKTFTLTDNAHIRANLCAASACSPTFNNPDSTPKYIFVEGSINFASVKTASGSGPIVLINYGGDPSSKTGVCPYGGSLYLGQSGSDYTKAPALYLLAINGLCIDGTKFGTNSDPADAPMLGGISGKNIYIASSPSTPRPLYLDPTFPVDKIPINLSWRAVRYERL